VVLCGEDWFGVVSTLLRRVAASKAYQQLWHAMRDAEGCLWGIGPVVRSFRLLQLYSD